MRKDIFIINPAAGKEGQAAKAAAAAERAAAARGLDYEILWTEYKGQAAELVSRIARENAPTVCRFYACGGDGTLNEVVCGAAEADNAEVACYPCGTGNDFIKLFSGAEHFLDFDALIDAPAIPLDLIRVGDRYALNVCSVGVDARVADWVGRNKRRLPLSGKLLYDFSVLVNFFGRLHRRYTVELDGERLDGDYAIIVAASGRYYGGGYFAVPEAEPDDGLLDFVLIRKLSHLKLVRLIGKYQSGRHREFGDLEIYRRGRRIVLGSEREEAYNCDGEILYASGVTIELAGKRLSVVLPAGAQLIRDAGEKLYQTAKI